MTKFYKMHGLGNDYIFFDCMQKAIERPEELSKKLSDRHFYIGADGAILLYPSKIADFKMRMFNADGSEGKMCGNGIRCLGKLARDLGYVTGDDCTAETQSGIKKLSFFYDNGGAVKSVKVDMGAPAFCGKAIPSTFDGERIISRPLEVCGQTYSVTLVNVGNPHCVIFCDPDEVDVCGAGKAIERHPAFPDGINVEFVKLVGANRLKMRVWERGSGETLACGTGACAAAVAAVENGFCARGEEITVLLAGGELKIEYSDAVYMTGDATLSYTGEINV